MRLQEQSQDNFGALDPFKGSIEPQREDFYAASKKMSEWAIKAEEKKYEKRKEERGNKRDRRRLRQSALLHRSYTPVRASVRV